MPGIYVSQGLVDRLLSADRVQVTGDRLVSKALPFDFLMKTAVYFEGVDGGSEDPFGVVGCVKDAEQLASLGAEHYDSSVILGEVAYTVRPGFLAVAVDTAGNPQKLEGIRWQAVIRAFSALDAPT